MLMMKWKPSQETLNLLRVSRSIYFEHTLLPVFLAAFFEDIVFASPDALGLFFAEMIPYVEKACREAHRTVRELLIKNENSWRHKNFCSYLVFLEGVRLKRGFFLLLPAVPGQTLLFTTGDILKHTFRLSQLLSPNHRDLPAREERYQRGEHEHAQDLRYNGRLTAPQPARLIPRAGPRGLRRRAVEYLHRGIRRPRGWVSP
jgi:hypothetical protein